MKLLRLLAVALTLSSFAAGFSASPRRHPVVSQQVRALARKLAVAWVQEAAPGTLDSLSQRSVAFAAMAPRIYVDLDGHRVSVQQVLTDSALTILGQHTEVEDASAIRKIVYTLTQVADGRARLMPRAAATTSG